MGAVRMSRFMFLVAAALLAQGAAAQTDNPPLWKVGNNVHVFGSFHMLPPDVQWRTPAVTRALEGAAVVVMETDVEGAADEKTVKPLFVQYGLVPAGQTLAGFLPPKANADLEKVAGGMGMPPGALGPMRPWFAALVLGVQFMVSQGFDPNKGVEQQVLAWAKQNGRRIESLESIESQLRVFADLTREQEVALLTVSLQQIREMPGMLNQLLAAYRKGDLATLEKLLNSSLDTQPLLKKRLIADRHRQWLPKIEAMAATGQQHFIAVGAAHTVGADGIVSMLRAKGYKVDGP